MDQQDGGIVEVIQPVPATQQNTLPNKKRKLDSIYTLQTISDSSDEGLGSMSPEPNQTSANGNMKSSNGSVNAKEFIEMKNILEIERRKNLALEERLRQLTECHPVYASDRVTYQHQEVIEHTNNLRPDTEDEEQIVVEKMHHNMQNVHVLSLESIPAVGQTQVVVCSAMDEDDDLMEHEANIIRGQHNIVDGDDDDSRTMSPCMMNAPIVKEEVIMSESRPNTPLDSHTHIHSHHLKSSGSVRLQPILEAAIKAEPKVEVERINSPNSLTVLKDCATESTNGSQSVNNRSSRMYVTNTSRQNLETIVEAIRHLEGDQLFGEMAEPTQEVPLALTNKPQRELQIEMNPFLQFRSGTTTSNAPIPTGSSQISHAPLLQAQLQHSQSNVGIRLTTVSSAPASTPASMVSHIQPPHQSINNRPGVIVVKQHS